MPCQFQSHHVAFQTNLLASFRRVVVLWWSNNIRSVIYSHPFFIFLPQLSLHLSDFQNLSTFSLIFEFVFQFGASKRRKLQPLEFCLLERSVLFPIRKARGRRLRRCHRCFIVFLRAEMSTASKLFSGHCASGAGPYKSNGLAKCNMCNAGNAKAPRMKINMFT